MQYILTVVNTTFNTGSVSEELTFDDFYDMADYVEVNQFNWQAYYITEEEV